MLSRSLNTNGKPSPPPPKEVSADKKKELDALALETLGRVIDAADDSLELEKLDSFQKKQFNDQIYDKLMEVLGEQGRQLSQGDKQKIIQQVTDEIFGYGPINVLLQDPAVTEIMINGFDNIYIERKGQLTKSEITFRDNDHVSHTLNKIIYPLGRRLDESCPSVDARLPDGSRVNAIIPPLSLRGPCVTIRKFSTDSFTVEDLVNFSTLTQEMADFLSACVRARSSMIVSGGTGSGKTTTLNVLSGFIPNNERIVTIEDTAELQMYQDNLVPLESRPANMEGKGEYTIRQLVTNSLRMRPDRIVIGEVRGGEALDMLQAMNTGHEGSISTLHANNPRDVLTRLETMVLMAGMELPLKAIREQIASAIDLFVQQSRLSDGSRKITRISEVIGLDGDTIQLQDIFVFKQEGFDEEGRIIGRHHPTGVEPLAMEKLITAGETFRMEDVPGWIEANRLLYPPEEPEVQEEDDPVLVEAQGELDTHLWEEEQESEEARQEELEGKVEGSEAEEFEEENDTTEECHLEGSEDVEEAVQEEAPVSSLINKGKIVEQEDDGNIDGDIEEETEEKIVDKQEVKADEQEEKLASQIENHSGNHNQNDDKNGEHTDDDTLEEEIPAAEKTAPLLDLETEAPAAAEIGEEASFYVTVTNRGEADLCNIQITDELLDWSTRIENLAPGQYRTFQLEMYIPGDRGEYLENTTYARAETLEGERLTMECGYGMEVLVPKVSLLVSGPSEAKPGEEVTISFTVQNESQQVDLFQLQLSDSLVGWKESVQTLAAGQVRLFKVDYRMPEDFQELSSTLRLSAETRFGEPATARENWSLRAEKPRDPGDAEPAREPLRLVSSRASTVTGELAGEEPLPWEPPADIKFPLANVLESEPSVTGETTQEDAVQKEVREMQESLESAAHELSEQVKEIEVGEGLETEAVLEEEEDREEGGEEEEKEEGNVALDEIIKAEHEDAIQEGTSLGQEEERGTVVEKDGEKESAGNEQPVEGNGWSFKDRPIRLVKSQSQVSTEVESAAPQPNRESLARRIPKGMRGISLPVNAVTGLSWLVQPGDWVDVICIEQLQDGRKQCSTVEKAAVLAMDGAGENGKGNVAAVILAVVPEQAGALACACLTGSFHLILRPSEE